MHGIQLVVHRHRIVPILIDYKLLLIKLLTHKNFQSYHSFNIKVVFIGYDWITNDENH